MTTQIVMASTLFAAAGAAAAVDEGTFGHPDRRLLLAVNSAPVPELNPALEEVPGAAVVLERFDGVVHLNDVVAPAHPQTWSPRPSEEPMFERLLRSHWGIGDDDVELVLESIAVPPARWLAKVFVGARIRVHADGLMTFGPTRTEVPHRTAGRITELCYLDLVPGLRPALLTEHAVPSRPVSTGAMRAVFEKLAAEGLSGARADGRDGPWGGPADETAVVVGQYLSALGLLSREEEGDLHAEMVAEAARRGARRVVFKPHPSAPPGLLDPMRDAAADSGVELSVLEDERPVEVLMALERPRLMVACFSTALMTARSIFDVETVAVGTRTVLERLQPFANSNRVPVTIIDALHRDDGGRDASEDLQPLVDAVAYVMQDWRMRHARERAVEVLDGMDPAERARYFDASRLARLALPGGTRTLATTARRAVDRVGVRNALVRVDRATGGAVRRAARRWR